MDTPPVPFLERGEEPSCEGGGDAPQEHSQAIALPRSYLCRGQLEGLDENGSLENIDSYAVTLGEYETVPLTVFSRTLFIEVCTYYPWPERTLHDCNSLGSGSAEIALGGMGGRWIITVATLTGTGIGEYVLALHGADTQLGSDCDSSSDAPAEQYGGLVIPFPTSCEAAFQDDEDVDWYAIELPADAFLEIHAVGRDAPLHLCVIAPGPSTYRCDFDAANTSRIATAFSAGTWRVGLFQAYGWGPTRYSLDIAPAPPISRDDCGTGRDATWQIAEVEPLSWPIQCAGEIDAFDNLDLYGLQLKRDEFVQLHLESAGEIEVCFASPTWYSGGESCAAGTGPLDLTFGDQAGLWLIDVRAQDAGTPYTLRVSLNDRPAQDDCGIGRDAPDLIDASHVLPFPVACTGTVDGLDTHDLYKTPVEGGTLVELRIEAFRGCFALPSGPWRCFDDDFRRVLQVGQTGQLRIILYYPTWEPSAEIETYSVSVAAGSPAPAQDDCGLGRDASESYPGEPVTAPFTCAGYVDVLHEELGDMFHLHVPEGHSWRYTVDAPESAEICLNENTAYELTCERDVIRFTETRLYSNSALVQVGRSTELDGYAYEVRVELATIQNELGTLLAGADIVPEIREPTADATAAWVLLDQTALGGGQERLRLETRPTAGLATASLEVRATFHDADRQPLEGGCIPGWGGCSAVPVGTTWVRIASDAGALVDWSLDYEYFPRT